MCRSKTRLTPIELMFGFLSEPQHMPCLECGASVARAQRDEHVCEQERWLTYQMFQLRGEIERLEAEVRTYFSSPNGRFELWYAARQRRRGRPGSAS